jgi:hypothetical protein
MRSSTPATSRRFSVHVYGPALRHMRRYIVDLEAGLVQISLERAGVGW